MLSLPVTEQTYVHSIYSCNTRHYVWPCVKSFLVDKTSEQIGLEIGCGNGKNIIYNNKLNILGIDTCKEFLQLNPNLNTIYSDCCRLPFQKLVFTIYLQTKEETWH